MRIKIILSKLDKYRYYSIPVDVNYFISVNLYKMFIDGNIEFANWLHTSGFEHEGKTFKMFTFSRLNTPGSNIKEGKYIVGKTDPYLFFSTIDLKGYRDSFVKGALETNHFFIANTDFNIKNLSLLNEPDLKYSQQYKMISPTVVARGNPGATPTYLVPNSEDKQEIIERFAVNLKRKYFALHKKKYNDILQIEFVQGRQTKEYYTKLITIKNTHIKCFLTMLNITANPEMQKIAYQVGVGEKNSMGFGMLEVV